MIGLVITLTTVGLHSHSMIIRIVIVVFHDDIGLIHSVVIVVVCSNLEKIKKIVLDFYFFFSENNILIRYDNEENE